MNTKDIRQSPNWAKYLESLGWQSIRTSADVNVEIMTTFFGTLVKVQRPKPLETIELTEIETLIKGKRPLFIKIESSQGQNEQVLQELGYEKSNAPLIPPSTFVIDLGKSENELWKNLSRSGKRFTKFSQKKGTQTTSYQNPNAQKIEAFQKILAETAKRKKFFAPSLKDLKTKVEIFKDNAILVEAKTKEGILVGGYFCLCYENTAWFIHGATTKSGRKHSAGYALMWEAIKYCKSQGYEFFDLEGKDDDRFPNFTKTWEGFSHFKEKFGAREIKFPYPYIKYLNPLLKKLVQIAGTSI